MTSAQQISVLAGANSEIAFDNLTRQLYATDASIYRVEPVAVAFPANTRQASALVLAAAQAGVSVIPRGAGTGLVGGAIGEGLVIDFSRHNRHICDLDLERQTIRVGPGVVLDNLNLFLRPHGYCFGPDVATSSRATLGGMIANNSSGAYTAVYGTVADHVHELEIVLADGRVVMIGPGHDTLRKERELIADILYFHSLEIIERLPPTLQKRRPGYAFDRLVRSPDNLTELICGSEGTLAAITSAELKIVKLPQERALAVIYFDSVAEAMQATVQLLDLDPAAIEHVDRVLFDQTRGNHLFKPARELLGLDDETAQSLLLVEFFDNSLDKISALLRKKLGSRTLVPNGPAESGLIWALRKAGLSLLTGCKGSAKPVTGIEDAAVSPAQLPEFVEELTQILTARDLQASFYGHARSGLLHVRPVLDLHSVADVRKFKEIAAEVSLLVSRFKGSLAGEHGVGIARTQYMAEQVGEALLGAMRQVKHCFDPHNVMNPGKIIPEGTFSFDSFLRVTPGSRLQLPFETTLEFAAKDNSFIGNLEQCNGCGGCRKESPSMCPTFLVTGQEVMSTRGRANIIRSVLEGQIGHNGSILQSPELQTVLSSCLGCKACATECPSNVDLPLLKAELLHARIKQDGLSLRQRVFSSVDLLGSIGCRFPWLANLALDSFFLRTMVYKLLGIGYQRPLPHYTKHRFDHWFRSRPSNQPGPRGRVVLWDDTFVRYHEPNIGVAAVKVLEAAGYQVTLAKGRKCCGRPAFSQGHLDRARRLGEFNVALLGNDADQAPVIFLEPSCYTMFSQDYIELNIDGAAQLATRCFLFEDFIEQTLTHYPEALTFKSKAGKIMIHAHCHVKAVMDPRFLKRLAERLPQREVTLLDSACCGMAGAFGALAANYELSLNVAEPLMQKIRAQPFGTAIVASGTSCRHQIAHLAPVRARHMAEILAEALA
jgi:FAD/FMN-containing dehydrogenase/Fe-S oxidoreductase